MNSPPFNHSKLLNLGGRGQLNVNDKGVMFSRAFLYFLFVVSGDEALLSNFAIPEEHETVAVEIKIITILILVTRKR